jgi:hypothetical protein
MQRRTIQQEPSNAWEELTAFIFRIPACFLLVSCLAYSSTLKVEAICSSETLIGFHRTRNRHSYGCENSKFNIIIFIWRFLPKLLQLKLDYQKDQHTEKNFDHNSL